MREGEFYFVSKGKYFAGSQPIHVDIFLEACISAP